MGIIELAYFMFLDYFEFTCGMREGLDIHDIPQMNYII